MPDLLRPLHFLRAWFATLRSRRAMLEIDFLKDENRLLRRQLGTKRLRRTDADRRELAAKALALGRKGLRGLVSIVSPETLLRWLRLLIAAEWTRPGRRPGRLRTPRDVRTMVVRFARENASWGYSRLMGANRNLGLPVGRTTIRAILKENGIEPAPERQASWRQFLAQTLLLADNDTKFTAQFRRILADAGLASVRLPIAAPNSNAIAERFVRSIERECLERRILFGEESLRRVLREYVAHYRGERNHQGIGNDLIAPKPGDVGGRGRVVVRRRLGGLRNFCRRKAG